MQERAPAIAGGGQQKSTFHFLYDFNDLDYASTFNHYVRVMYKGAYKSSLPRFTQVQGWSSSRKPFSILVLRTLKAKSNQSTSVLTCTTSICTLLGCQNSETARTSASCKYRLLIYHDVPTFSAFMCLLVLSASKLLAVKGLNACLPHQNNRGSKYGVTATIASTQFSLYFTFEKTVSLKMVLHVLW